MALVVERDWSKRDRSSWWIKYLLALGTGLASVRTADEAVGYYLKRSGMETVESSRAEHAEIEKRSQDSVARIEAKLDQLMVRVDALYAKGGQ